MVGKIERMSGTREGNGWEEMSFVTIFMCGTLGNIFAA